MKAIPLILCGGVGTRLWPLSRACYPKQLLSLVDDGSLLQNTVKRFIGYEGMSSPLLVCNQAHRFLVAEQLREMDVRPRAILLEPVAKNTAPAVALGAFAAIGQDGDALLVVIPSDHVIADRAGFHMALSDAVRLARKDYLVTFGVVPTSPETSYGYIRPGQPVDDCPKGAQVEFFVEKPDKETADRYLAQGGYYWNSGIFVFRASRFLEELEAYRPDIFQAVGSAAAAMTRDTDFMRLDDTAFVDCPSESVDYAVMEKTGAAAVVPLDAGWRDIGSWDALWQSSKRDPADNALVGDVMVENVEGSYIRAEHRLVSVVDLSDLVVVETADAVLVASRDGVRKVSSIVDKLAKCERDEQLAHRKVYRPWGHYETLDEGENYRVTRMTVAPCAGLSLQRHARRAGHWVVVNGCATVTRGEEVFELHPHESTCIPVGCKHRLHNRQSKPLEVIEVQSGPRLGKDDIEPRGHV